MFGSLNVFQMVVLVLILVGVVMIFIRQNNTCVMKQNKVKEGFNNVYHANFKRYDNKNIWGHVIGTEPLSTPEEEVLNRCDTTKGCIGMVKYNSRNIYYLLGNNRDPWHARNMSGITSHLKESYIKQKSDLMNSLGL
jgi:hypothetical protein